MKQYNKNGRYSKTFVKYMKEMYKRYNESTQTDLHQCYVKPSQAKIDALNYIKAYKAETKPYIISHNTHHFVVAYFTTEEEESYFCVDTGRNTYVILDIYI